MRVVVATVRTPFVSGGAEVHAQGLVDALVNEGHEADLVAIPFNPVDPESIPDLMLACGLMDMRETNAGPVDRLIALKFPAYLLSHPNKVIWLLHQHRSAYDLWEHPLGYLHPAPRGRIIRDIIRQADAAALAEAKAVFSNSRNVAQRLRKFSQVESLPLYHPPGRPEAFFCADESEDYFFFPSRLSPT